jgi:hypothetical protein
LGGCARKNELTLAAEGCDLLILLLKTKSKDRSLRQLLQGSGIHQGNSQEGEKMKSILCLLIAAAVGAALQVSGVPHGLLLGRSSSPHGSPRAAVAPATPYGLGYIQVTLGIATGLMFEAWDSATASAMLPSLGVLLLCLTVQIALAGWWLTRGAGWNRTDALLAYTPAHWRRCSIYWSRKRLRARSSSCT